VSIGHLANALQVLSDLRSIGSENDKFEVT
jgi:hypothetical protein